MLRFSILVFLTFLGFTNESLFAASNPVPLIYQPLIPASVRPGSAAFTLTVNGAHFVRGAIVHWNGVPLATTFVSRSRLRAAVPAAKVTKANTASITVSNPTSGAIKSNVVDLPVRVPSSSVTFKLDGSVTTPGGVLAGDFNHDGNPDIIVGTNSASLKIDAFLGKGDGSFTPLLAATTQLFPPVGALAADFNGDGILDLAATLNDGSNPAATAGQIFLGKGHGTFTDSGGGVEGTPVGIGDFHGNGKLDLITCTNDFFGNTGFAFYPGNGDGTFGTSAVLAEGPLTSSAPSYPAIADFNGDGKLDLAFPGVSVYLGNGDGTFQPALNSAATQFAASVVAADLNGDGKLDLVADGSCVFVGHGNGTFTQGKCVAYPAGLTVIFFALADMNGDGKLDIVTLAADENHGNFPQTLFIALGNGDGTFKNPVKLPAGEFNILLTTGLGIADFNHDGKLDIVLGSLNRTFVYLQQ